MKQKLYEEYLPYLAKQTGLLFLSDNHLDAFDAVKNKFSSAIQRNITPSALEHLSNTLIHSKINFVILDATIDKKILVGLIEKIKYFDISISTILVYDNKDLKKILPVIPNFNFIIERTQCSAYLVEKLFMLLSVSFTLNKLSQENKYICNELNVAVTNDMEEYLDTYEGMSLFAIEDLSSICSRLRSGELSYELINNAGKKLHSISSIFSKNTKMQSISPILESLSLFLDSLDFSKLEPSHLKAFDYLAAILDDISGALLNMFVDRIFTNVYIIEHSLENNIYFMKNTLLGISDNSSKLDFF